MAEGQPSGGAVAGACAGAGVLGDVVPAMQADHPGGCVWGTVPQPLAPPCSQTTRNKGASPCRDTSGGGEGGRGRGCPCKPSAAQHQLEH
eukprot:351055-Chlamydomonas_euryale.AAC.4